MSITYEEALGTLTAMFSNPWTEESLDAVLRHFEGHMENTVDAVLAHGDSNPQELVQRLEQSRSGTSMAEMDEQLARQLASQEQNQQSNPTQRPQQQQQYQQPSSPPRGLPSTNRGVPPSSSSVPASTGNKGRGTPTSLPPDFLRIPGAPNAAGIASDEALARMLQDKLFAEEIKNNPEFAHLARGRSNFDPRLARGAAGGPREGPDVIKALQGMGEQAKKRFQDLATKFKNKLNENQRQNQNGFGSGGVGGGAAERRGLLDIHEDDDDEQEISFVGGGSSRPDYEMRSMAAGGAKKHD